MPTEKHDSFAWPQDHAVRIWRYMDLAKFVASLQDTALHFSRADCLGDPFEGSVPLLNSGEALRAELEKHPELAKQTGKDGLTIGQISEMRNMLAQSRRQMLQSFYCSCWHMNEHESAAMWRLYCQSNEAICIQSTFERLENALPSWTFVGAVRYVDYERDTIDERNLFNPIMTKRKSYEHERELRGVAWSLASKETGGEEVARAIRGKVVVVPLNLRAVIEAVYLSPTSPTWFRNVVEHLLHTHGFSVEVKQSALDAQPLY